MTFLGRNNALAPLKVVINVAFDRRNRRQQACRSSAINQPFLVVVLIQLEIGLILD